MIHMENCKLRVNDGVATFDYSRHEDAQNYSKSVVSILDISVTKKRKGTGTKLIDMLCVIAAGGYLNVGVITSNEGRKFIEAVVPKLAETNNVTAIWFVDPDLDTKS